MGSTILSDLIYTDSSGEDVGVIKKYKLDMAIGKDENNFELVVSKDVDLEIGSYIYFENTEYGGIIDSLQIDTNLESIRYSGRTWHGILDTHAIINLLEQPNNFKELLSKSITDNNLDTDFIYESIDLIDEVNFQVIIEWNKWYYGIYRLIFKIIKKIRNSNDINLKIKMYYANKKIYLSIVRAKIYDENENLQNNETQLTLEKVYNTVNHLICMCRENHDGSISDRKTFNYCINQNNEICILLAPGEVNPGKLPIINNLYYIGMKEIVEIYEYPSVDTYEEIEESCIEKFEDLLNVDKVLFKLSPNIEYDIGDIVEARETMKNILVRGIIMKKILTVVDGEIKINYDVEA